MLTSVGGLLLNRARTGKKVVLAPLEVAEVASRMPLLALKTVLVVVIRTLCRSLYLRLQTKLRTNGVNSLNAFTVSFL